MSNSDCAKVSKRVSKPRKKNAMAHGIYGEDVLLPWESRKDFERLLTDLREEFRPDGRMEDDIVFDLAHLRWQKYRLHKLYAAAAHRDPFVSDLVKARRKSWAGMRDHLRRESENERGISHMLTEVFLEQTEKVAETVAKAVFGSKLNNSEVVQAKAYLDVSTNFTLPLIETFESRPSAEDSLRRTYSTKYLEPIIRLDAMIDARIDKALARLVSLKEYKRVAAAVCRPATIPADVSTSFNNQTEAESGITIIAGILEK
jgi:hypothetical protein